MRVRVRLTAAILTGNRKSGCRDKSSDTAKTTKLRLSNLYELKCDVLDDDKMSMQKHENYWSLRSSYVQMDRDQMWRLVDLTYDT